jgi:hypothetical protein
MDFKAPAPATLAILTLATSLLGACRPIAAHDWYPWECCSNLDCAPVIAAEVLPDASLRVTTRHGTIVVPSSFERRESKDNRLHACMRPDEHGTMQPICLFVPPSI